MGQPFGSTLLIMRNTSQVLTLEAIGVLCQSSLGQETNEKAEKHDAKLS